MEKANTYPTKSKPKRLSIRRAKENRPSAPSQDEDGNEVVLPPKLRRRLWELFSEIEREFEKIHADNNILRERLDCVTDKYNCVVSGSLDQSEAMAADSVGSHKASAMLKKPSASQLMSQKLKTTYKASTSKIVSSFKIPNPASSNFCSQVHVYRGHRDGVWEVTTLPQIRSNQPIIGTASADRTARIWSADSPQCFVLYQGHSGSVNSIRFHPNDALVCTGSGDGTCHVWKYTLSNPEVRNRSPLAQESPIVSQSESGDEIDDEVDANDGVDGQHPMKVKQPMAEYSGHEGPVSSADWWSGGKQLVTASWDRTLKLWDAESSVVVHTLEGHEMEITHACCHSIQKLIVSSSQDSTFRLWDFRLPALHSVNVFQGHTDSVTSAVFTHKADHVVSGSDDRTIKVWDLKNMRSPLATVRFDSAVNRLSVSPAQNTIAIPHDNRQVRLYDLNGNRITRLPRRHGQGHQRMVCSTAWLDDCVTNKSLRLFTAGFDKNVINWKVAQH